MSCPAFPRAFLAESPRSKLLFTTRDGAIASVTGAWTYSAELLMVEQARDLLAKWVDTGRALLMLEGHSHTVYGVAVTPDGKRAVSAPGTKR